MVTCFAIRLPVGIPVGTVLTRDYRLPSVATIQQVPPFRLACNLRKQSSALHRGIELEVPSQRHRSIAGAQCRACPMATLCTKSGTQGSCRAELFFSTLRCSCSGLSLPLHLVLNVANPRRKVTLANLSLCSEDRLHTDGRMGPFDRSHRLYN